MAVPKIVSPRGMLLLAIGVAISAGFASSQPIDVVEPFPHPNHGCPYLQYWQSYGGCKRLYRATKDGLWVPVDGYNRRVVWYKTYECCPEGHLRGFYCRYRNSYGHQAATCALADNYCPTLDIVSAEKSECVGKYKQVSNSTWVKEDDNTLKLKVVGREDFNETSATRKLKFSCFKDKVAAALGAVKEFKCNNPLLPDGLKYGLNKIKDDSIYVVGHHGPLAMSEGGFFRSYQVETTVESSDQKLWVWALSGSWKMGSTVVIAQMFNDDNEPATVELTNARECSFRLRLPHATCNRKHQKERINILHIKLGLHRGSDGQMITVGKLDVTGDKPAGRRYSTAVDFPTLPVVFTQIHHLLKGPEHGYINTRIVSRDRSKFEVKLQQLNGMSADGFSARVAFVAVSTLSNNAGLFGTHYVVTHGENSSDVEMDHEEQHVFFDNKGPDGFLHTPQVFVETVTVNEGDGYVERLDTSSPVHASFKLLEDTCNSTSTSTHAKEEYGLLAIGKAFTVTKPEECVLIVDANVLGMFIYRGKTFNQRPVYRKINEQGGWSDREIYYKSKNNWQYYVYAQNHNWWFGWVKSDDPVCPHDGALFGYQKIGMSGRIYRAKPPTWTMCSPVKNVPVPASVTSTKTLPPTPRLTECARRVMGVYPDATGAQWEQNKCVALFGTDVKIPRPKEGPKVATTLGCVFQCNLMPGVMKNWIPSRHIGTVESIQECVGSVRSAAPHANAMTFSRHNLTCTAEIDGRHPVQVDTDGNDARTCWIGSSTPVFVPAVQ